MPSHRLPRLVLYLSLGTACNSGGDDDGEAGDASEATSDGAATGPTTEPGATGEDTSGDDGPVDEADVWQTPYCHPVRDGMAWPAPLPAWEEEVLTLVNAARAAGHDCDSKGNFGPAPPLTMNASLRCAARKHAADMSMRDYFDHVSPDGEDFVARIAQAGYGSYAQIGENIAGGLDLDNAKAAVDGWLASDGHCANIMNEFYTEFGAAAYEGSGKLTFYWVQEFGRPN
jgi:uncharacterized protein YkwD